jgi:hypothetical protein
MERIVAPMPPELAYRRVTDAKLKQIFLTSKYSKI